MSTKAKVAAWLKEKDWTFTEITEAQKVEMRATLDICGAATAGSKRQQPCPQKPMRNGTGRCRNHGGKTPRGIASPNYAGKGYSRYSPAKWIPSLEAAANDPQLLDLRRDIELAEAGLNEALERMDLGTGDDQQMAELVGSVRTMLQALDRGDDQTSGQMLTSLPDLVEAAVFDEALKIEVRKWIQMRVELIAEDSRVQHRLQLTVPLEEVGRQFVLLGDAIKLNIGRLVDRQAMTKDDATRLLQAISDDFTRVAGFASLPGDSADRD